MVAVWGIAVLAVTIAESIAFPEIFTASANEINLKSYVPRSGTAESLIC